MPTCLLLPPNDRQAGAAPALPSHYLRPWAGSSSAHVPICLRPSVQPGRTTGTTAAAAATTESNPRVSQDEQSRPSITTPPPASPLNLLPQRRYYSPSAAAIPKANLLLAQQLLLGVHRATERCRSDGSQASELGETVLMFHVALAQCCCCTLLHCTLLHNAPLFLSSVAQICPMQGGKKKRKEGRKKRFNLSPPLKLNKSASRLLPQAARWSSAGFSPAVRRLFCAGKLGRSSESSCYSRNGLGFLFFFLLPPHFQFPSSP